VLKSYFSGLKKKKTKKNFTPKKKDIRGVLLVMVKPIPIMLSPGNTPNIMHNDKTI